MTKLPETIEIEGKVFHLVCEQISKDTTIIPGGGVPDILSLMKMEIK